MNITNTQLSDVSHYYSLEGNDNKEEYCGTHYAVIWHVMSIIDLDTKINNNQDLMCSVAISEFHLDLSINNSWFGKGWTPET